MQQASSRGPLAGLAILAVLLAALSATVGIGGAGWLAGVAYGLVLTVALSAGLRRAGMRKLGPANVVTLGRALLVGGVTALVAYSFQRPAPTTILVTLVAVALALDGVDGQVARRTGSTSALGARFDMEIDAFLILVLSVFVAGPLGWWTIAIGAFRYVFVAASWAWPWLTAALPPKFSRKVVAAVQGVVLVVATAGLLPHAVTFVAVAAALASLTWSFGRDIGWLWTVENAQRRIAIIPVSPAPAPQPVAIVPALPIFQDVPALPIVATYASDPAPQPVGATQLTIVAVRPVIAAARRRWIETAAPRRERRERASVGV